MPRTLYLRNVPDELAERLEQEAAREGTSLNAVAVRTLERATRRRTNAEILADLPVIEGITTQDILDALDEGRAERGTW